MKVVHIITRFITGGAEENTILTCNSQHDQGESVVLIVGREMEPKMCARLSPNVEFIVLESLVRNIAPVTDLRCLLALRRLLKDLRADVVHTHTSKAGILGRLAAWTVKTPMIVHGVHILPFINVSAITALLYVTLERLVGNMTHLFVHVSQGMQEQCQKHHIGCDAHHVVIESGMDVDRFRNAPLPEDREALSRSPAGEGPATSIVLFLAALEPRKGHAGFLPLFRKVVDQHPDTVLLLGGAGPLRQVLQERVQELGLQDHVRFLGYRNDPESLLAMADVLVVCSSQEGLPRVAVQAAIAGVPIVTTALPGIEAIVRDGQTGFIVPVDNLSSMTEALNLLLSDPELRARFSETMAALDMERWSPAITASRMAAAYAQAWPDGEYPGHVRPQP